MTVLHIDGRGNSRPFAHGDALLSRLEAIKLSGDSFSTWAQHQNADAFDTLLAKDSGLAARIKGVRVDGYEEVYNADAFSDAGGLALARDLDFVHQKVLEEASPANNALNMFATGTGIPQGARTHSVRRLLYDGEAAWHRGGNNAPRVGVRQKEEQFPVRHIVTSVEMNLFEMMSSNFANLNAYQRKLRGARKVMEKFLNHALWNGDEDQGYKGVLNYPYLAKKTAATAFDGSATAAAMLAELNSAANYPGEQSGAVFMPNRMVTSPRVKNLLMQTQNSTASDTTLGEYFLRNNDEIARIEAARELKDFNGVSGVDAILFYNDEPDSISHETVAGIQILPRQVFGFDEVTYMYMSTGGIVMRDAGNNILLLVTAA